jgi:CRISPR-associated protein (TIGR02584 family)
MTPDPRQPHEYQRRILLVVIGMTPQIVTETLFKLAVEARPAFVPTEIHLITTAEGAHSAKLALLGLDREPGWFHRLCSDYALPAIRFEEEMVHVIADTEGNFIDDDQSSAHNRIAADFITRTVHEMTRDPDSALHVSLAGGRKTMSFYAGYALSLYGRMQDRLSHVLINEPFQNRDLFYPPPKPMRLRFDGHYFSTAQMRILLSDIPFVRMRYEVPERLISGQAGFHETIDAIQRAMGPPQVEIGLAEKTLRLNGEPIRLDDSELTLYLWMCRRLLQDESALDLDADDFMADYLQCYADVVDEESAQYERAQVVARERGIKDQKSKFFFPKKSRLHKKIRDALGEKIATPFLIQTIEREGRAAYGLTLPKEAIRVQ